MSSNPSSTDYYFMQKQVYYNEANAIKEKCTQKKKKQ